MELTELIWSRFSPTDNETVRLATPACLEELHHYGIADNKRVPLGQWTAAFAKFKPGKGGYLLTLQDLEKLKPLFYSANIRKPFDPNRLKEGPRPLNWLTEIYQKVLRFETNLTVEEWKIVAQEKINPSFVKGDQIFYNKELRKLLQEIVDTDASPLRRLELWVHEGRGPGTQAPTPAEPEKKSAPNIIKDSYQAKPEEIQKKMAIDKLFYQFEHHPQVDDKSSLSFLDELANLEDEDKELGDL
jgi:hypothetical protein